MTRLEAERGLAIRHYPGKWRSAQQIAEREWHITHPKFWETVRLRYLELGGLFVDQLTPEQREHVAASVRAFFIEER